MSELALEASPVVRTEMLIRRPAREVFNAFIDPRVTMQFWFTRSSGPLEAGHRVRWEWEMYGVGTDVIVREVVQDKCIVIAWDEPATTVEWTFDGRDDGTTFVTITNTGFTGSGDSVVRQAIDAMGGFCYVLAGLKALLEHGVRLNLVADHFPDAHV